MPARAAPAQDGSPPPASRAAERPAGRATEGPTTGPPENGPKPAEDSQPANPDKAGTPARDPLFAPLTRGPAQHSEPPAGAPSPPPAAATPAGAGPSVRATHTSTTDTTAPNAPPTDASTAATGASVTRPRSQSAGVPPGE
jgi:hypothetical protein